MALTKKVLYILGVPFKAGEFTKTRPIYISIVRAHVPGHVYHTRDGSCTALISSFTDIIRCSSCNYARVPETIGVVVSVVLSSIKSIVSSVYALESYFSC